LAVSLGVIANPSPEILTSILKCELGPPAQLLVGTSGIGCQIKNIACSSLNNIVLERVSNDFAEGVDHLEDSAAAARSEIPCSDTGMLLSEVVEGCEMALSEIDYVDVVADCGPVSGGVVFHSVSLNKHYYLKKTHHLQRPKASLSGLLQLGLAEAKG